MVEVEIESQFFEVSMIEFFDTLKRIKVLKRAKPVSSDETMDIE
jgi:hypothetical protein